MQLADHQTFPKRKEEKKAKSQLGNLKSDAENHFQIRKKSNTLLERIIIERTIAAPILCCTQGYTYMIGYGTGKIILNLPGISRAKNFKVRWHSYVPYSIIYNPGCTTLKIILKYYIYCIFTWLPSVVETTAPGPTFAADLAATGEAEADVVGVVPFKGLVAVLVASLTS